jgi:hypothetical protein
MRIAAVLAGLAAAAALLAGCSSTGGGGAPPLLCPRPAIVDGLASIERYRPGADAGDPAALAYRAALQNIGGTCTEDGQDLAVDVSVELVVEPGPAFVGPVAEVPYFVAVVGPGDAVVDRRDYVARVTVPEGARRGGVSEGFSQRFVGVGRQGGAGYRVLFGFALPREEGLRRVAPGASGG